jgi:hypothetical protein
VTCDVGLEHGNHLSDELDHVACRKQFPVEGDYGVVVILRQGRAVDDIVEVDKFEPVGKLNNSLGEVGSAEVKHVNSRADWLLIGGSIEGMRGEGRCQWL